MPSIHLIFGLPVPRFSLWPGQEYKKKLLRIKINEGHAVVQLVEALRYKPEGRGFDSRWCHWSFLLT